MIDFDEDAYWENKRIYFEMKADEMEAMESRLGKSYDDYLEEQQEDERRR